MSIPENSIKQSKLPGRLILDYETTETLGRVDCLWLEPQSHTVAGLTSKEGLLGRHQHMLPWSCIKKIGEDSILVEGQGVDANIAKPDAAFIAGHELWTDEGKKVGHVVDYIIDPDTGAVVSYLFKPKGWSGLMDGVYHLPPGSVESIGNERLIAQADAIRQSEKYEQGLEQTLSSAQELVKGDLAKTKDDLTTVAERGRSLAAQLKEKTQSISRQVKEKIGHAGRSPKEKS
ncbi:MAG: PRC-barrel domain-containing protein [Elainellaceae cyanobacterium]